MENVKSNLNFNLIQDDERPRSFVCSVEEVQDGLVATL